MGHRRPLQRLSNGGHSAPPLAACAGGACHNCYGHRDIVLGCRTQSQPLQRSEACWRFLGGKSLARWRDAAPTAKSVKKLRSNKYSNKIPIAYERRPDLFPQARGQLHWGQVRQERRKILCSRRPLQRLVQEYVDEHKDEFEAESARRPLQRFFQEYVDQEPAASFRSELVRLELEPVSNLERTVATRSLVRYGMPGVADDNLKVCANEDWVRLCIALRRACLPDTRITPGLLREWKTKVASSIVVRRKCYIGAGGP